MVFASTCLNFCFFGSVLVGSGSPYKTVILPAKAGSAKRADKWLTLSVEPDLIKFFSSTLSSAGSISSPTSSIKSGSPLAKASSRCVRKYLWFRFVTLSPFFDSRFVIQILPWPWGSISSGNRVADVTMIPFWVDNSSEGRPRKNWSNSFELSDWPRGTYLANSTLR